MPKVQIDSGIPEEWEQLEVDLGSDQLRSLLDVSLETTWTRCLNNTNIQRTQKKNTPSENRTRDLLRVKQSSYYYGRIIRENSPVVTVGRAVEGRVLTPTRPSVRTIV